MRKYFIHDDERTGFDTIIHWSKLSSNGHDSIVPVTCKCGKERIIKVENLNYSKGKGLCPVCSRKVFCYGYQHPSFLSPTYIAKNGYRYVRFSTLSPEDQVLVKLMVDRNGLVREHRLVMARKLGRPLVTKEQVHHRDGNKLNNNPDNLELVTNGQHQTKYHQNNRELLREIERLRYILNEHNIPY